MTGDIWKESLNKLEIDEANRESLMALFFVAKVGVNIVGETIQISILGMFVLF